MFLYPGKGHKRFMQNLIGFGTHRFLYIFTNFALHMKHVCVHVRLSFDVKTDN